MKPIVKVLSAVLTALCAAQAVAQSYPSKSVRIIVPYAPGGGVDIMARIAAQKYGERLGQQFIVDNRAGGGTIIGTEIAARAAADGHTLLFANPGLTSSAAFNDKLPFDPVQSFAPVGLFASSFNVLLVHPSLPVKSLQTFVALAKAKPKAVNWYGMVAPAQTPREIVARLNSELNAMLAAGEVRERVIALGNEPAGGTPEQFAERIRKEVVLWQSLFAGLKK